MSDDYGWCQSCGVVVVNSQHCHICGGTMIPICVEAELIKQNKRIEELEAEIQEVSNQLLELYDNCNETTRPAVYGTILGLHERLEQTLKGG
jgi:hypothetical protein